MKKISLNADDDDEDTRFVQIVEAFVDYYVTLFSPPTVFVIRIDHWFGAKWLGFRGKLLGAIGVHADVSDVERRRMPMPPFSPSRVKRFYYFTRHNDEWDCSVDNQCVLHAKKSGDEFQRIYRRGLYCWYSGGTRTNTCGSMMIYDVNEIGANGWHLSFEFRTTWKLTKCVNVSGDVSNRILFDYYAAAATEQTIGREALDRPF